MNLQIFQNIRQNQSNQRILPIFFSRINTKLKWKFYISFQFKWTTFSTMHSLYKQPRIYGSKNHIFIQRKFTKYYSSVIGLHFLYNLQWKLINLINGWFGKFAIFLRWSAHKRTIFVDDSQEKNLTHDISWILYIRTFKCCPMHGILFQWCWSGCVQCGFVCCVKAEKSIFSLYYYEKGWNFFNLKKICQEFFFSFLIRFYFKMVIYLQIKMRFFTMCRVLKSMLLLRPTFISLMF